MKAAIALDRDYQEAWYYLGLIAAERGDTDAAVRAWQATTQIDAESEAGKWAATKVQMVTAQAWARSRKGRSSIRRRRRSWARSSR